MNLRLSGVAATLTFLISLSAPLPAPAASAGAAGLKPGSVTGRFQRAVELPGSVLPGLAAAHRISPLARSQMMSIGITFRLRNEANLRLRIHQVGDRHSPHYHHYLTPQQFAREFTPLQSERQNVMRWLRSHHLRVVQQFRNGLQLVLTGSVQNVEGAFSTTLYHYSRGSGSFFANDRSIQIPAYIAASVSAVSGLSNAAHAFRDRSGLSPVSPRRDIRNKADGPGGLWPSDLAKIYDLKPIYDQGMMGQNQTIALFEYADFNGQNVSTYDNQFGLSTGPVQRVNVSDGKNSGAGLTGEDECELDIEIAHSVAPEATTLVYEAPNSTLGGIAMWNRIVSDNRASIISTSWSSPEWNYYPFEIWAINAALEEAAVQGQTVFTSTGDNGAYSDHASPNHLSVRFPGSDPWVTSVGGTTLTANSDGTISESGWSDPTNSQTRIGGGGGLSVIFKRPNYQQGPGVIESASNGMRQVPDVAANADFQHSGYAVFEADKGKPGAWYVAGGTSASAPLWASYAVLLNQAGTSRIGFFNPTLYSLGQQQHSLQYAPFYDVTSGNNLYYSAGPEWDFSTGWGSFDATAMLVDLAKTGLTPYPSPAVIYSVDNDVAKKTGSHFSSLTTVKRGSTAYLVLYVTVNRLPAVTSGSWHLRFGTPKHALLSKGFDDRFTSADVGHQVTRFIKIKIPKSIAKGKYSFDATLTMGTDQEFALTVVKVT